MENGKQCFQEIFQKKGRPTAVFACNDLIAIGVIQGAREHGLNIPEDLSIVGFDNTILATTTVPSLTTVAQPIKEMGKKGGGCDCRSYSTWRKERRADFV